MKRYIVELTYRYTTLVDVLAESPKEASIKALTKLETEIHQNDEHICQTEVVFTEEI